MKIKHPRIAFQGTEGLILVQAREVMYAVAKGNYTEIYLENDQMIKVLRKLKEVDRLLPEEHFFRIHRSYLINLEYAIKFDQVSCRLILKNGIYLPIAQNRKSGFMERFIKI